MKKQVEIENKVDYSIDAISLNGKSAQINTYYNTLQNLFTANSYKSSIECESQLDARRRVLEIAFQKRVEFNIAQKLDFMFVYLRQYNINMYPIGGIRTEIKKVIPEIFELGFYFDLITNPVTGYDYAVALNTILYNTLFYEAKYLCEEENMGNFQQIVECLNRFMELTLKEWMHMLNLLYLEANEIYYNAGNIKLDIEEQYKASGFLEGDERKQALIEMGRPDLIDTDIQVGKI